MIFYFIIQSIQCRKCYQKFQHEFKQFLNVGKLTIELLRQLLLKPCNGDENHVELVISLLKKFGFLVSHTLENGLHQYEVDKFIVPAHLPICNVLSLNGEITISFF